MALQSRRVAKTETIAETGEDIEGRVAIEAIAPQVDGGRFAVKRIVGEILDVEADVFSDGHDVVAADVIWRPRGASAWRRAPMSFVDNDRWAGAFTPEEIGFHEYAVEAWRDVFATWARDVSKKRAAGQNVDTELQEGLALVLETVSEAPEIAALRRALGAPGGKPHALLDALLAPTSLALMREHGPREGVSRSHVFKLAVDRLRARFSSWYELFPRSASNDVNRHGTFDDVIGRLDYVRDLGFDVLYFPPIHPIGKTNRKGRNNSLTAGPDDPGSVYAIGAAEGGHDALHPELGTMDDFRRLVEAAAERGLELALDVAVQCSPDHPWIKQHPEWFQWRPDGTIKFAENPPKKYEDIVNVRFDGPARPGVWHALRDVIHFWADAGVRIFRIDNPHTKPLPFWEWLIDEVNTRYPDAIFLAEAFTRPKMMLRLAKVGFQQSYTYFTWRDTKQELISYMTELAGSASEVYRPNFFVNTPDINPVYLQTSGRPGFIVRATLAATLSSSWGVYSGFEICEAAPLPGREEYLDSEKYEIRARDFDAPGNIKSHIRRLNEIRNAHPALQDFRNVVFINAWHDDVLAYARMNPMRDGCIFVMVNLDPHQRRDCVYEAPLWEFGLPDDASIEVEDLLFGGRFRLYGKTHQIALDPAHNPVVIWRFIAPDSSASPEHAA